LRLNVEDDGVGFEVAEALTKRNSFGLAGMRERVTLLGGNLEIESRTSGGAKRKKSGARIIVELPISQHT
jgi:signal transduction histidine kinase